MSKQSDIKVVGFNIPKESLNNVVVSWRVSRSEQPAEEIIGEVMAYPHTRLQTELAEILFQDLPVREFVPIFFVVEGAPRCFPAGTKVLTKNMEVKEEREGYCKCGCGNKVTEESVRRWSGSYIYGHNLSINSYNSTPIENIKVGDEVLSYNESTAKKEWNVVTETFKNKADKLVKVNFFNFNELECTPNHPLYVVSRVGVENWTPKWVMAKELCIGDRTIQYNYKGLQLRIYSKMNKYFGTDSVQGAEHEKERRSKISKSVKLKHSNGEIVTPQSFYERAKELHQHRKGKTYEELYGEEKANELKEKLSSNLKEAFSIDPNDKRFSGLYKGQKPTKLEIFMEEFLDEYFVGEYKYVGDGGIWIDGSNPDFISTNGKKKVIEVFAKYWKERDYGSVDVYKSHKQKHYSKNGYDVLFIEDVELEDLNSVYDKVECYNHNPGIEIIEVINVSDEYDVDEWVYNIEVENNHNYFAYGILAHNSFWDQLDRHRVGFAFWEQSLRVRDLDAKFEYFVPPSLDNGETEAILYHDTMDGLHEAYSLLAKELPREDARGIIPLHIVTRGSVQANLRSILGLISARTCFFAQGTYWKPVVEDLIDGITMSLPGLMERRDKVLRLPCDGAKACRFEKDLLDRISDHSNPLCPIMIDKFCPKGYDRWQLVAEMEKRYPTYREDVHKYAERVGRSLDEKLFGTWNGIFG